MKQYVIWWGGVLVGIVLLGGVVGCRWHTANFQEMLVVFPNKNLPMRVDGAFNLKGRLELDTGFVRRFMPDSIVGYRREQVYALGQFGAVNCYPLLTGANFDEGQRVYLSTYTGEGMYISSLLLYQSGSLERWCDIDQKMNVRCRVTDHRSKVSHDLLYRITQDGVIKRMASEGIDSAAIRGIVFNPIPELAVLDSLYGKRPATTAVPAVDTAMPAAPPQVASSVPATTSSSTGGAAPPASEPAAQADFAFAGEYSNPTGLVTASIRKGSAPRTCRFSISSSNSDGSCAGDIRGEATLSTDREGSYSDKSGCRLYFRFTGSGLLIRETNCGDSHGFGCSFSAELDKVAGVLTAPKGRK
jgi:hypothetical protein